MESILCKFIPCVNCQEILMLLECMLDNLYDTDDNITITVIRYCKFSSMLVIMVLNIMASR